MIGNRELRLRPTRYPEPEHIKSKAAVPDYQLAEWFGVTVRSIRNWAKLLGAKKRGVMVETRPFVEHFLTDLDDFL